MDSKEVDKEVKVIENNFKIWLQMSNLTEKEFIKFRNVRNFKIICGEDSGYKILRLGYEIDNNFHSIGEQIAYPMGDDNSFADLCLLILYMAQKLDNANAVAPIFEQRKDYFYKITKDFIESTTEYKSVKK